MKAIRIMLVDDHALLRMGLAALLRSASGLHVVGEAEDGTQALERLDACAPDVVITDLMMPALDGVEVTRRIKARRPDTKVLVLTSFGTSADVARAIAAGAAGAILKTSPNDELIDAIRAVAAGKTAFSPEIARSLAEEPEPPEFSPRQREILESITRGLPNADIARQLGISTDAVKQHLSAICTKLGAANRTEAIAIALRRSLLKV